MATRLSALGARLLTSTPRLRLLTARPVTHTAVLDQLLRSLQVRCAL